MSRTVPRESAKGGKKRLMEAVRSQPMRLLFSASVVVLGVSALVFFSVWPEPLFRSYEPGWLTLVALAFSIVARTLSFRVFRHARVTIDSAFFVATAFVHGVLAAALIAILVSTGDAFLRELRSAHTKTPTDLAGWLGLVLRALHPGAISVLVLLTLGAAAGLDRHRPFGDWTVFWLAPVVLFAFVALRSFLDGGDHWFEGASSRELFRGYFMKVLVAEGAMAPLAVAMVLDHKHHGIELFVLFGLTALLFGAIYRRSTHTSHALDQRVRELEVINRVGRELTSSLERGRLAATIANQTLKLVGRSSRFVLGMIDPKSGQLVLELFDARGENLEQREVTPTAGLVGWVLREGKPLRLGDVESEWSRYATTDRELESGYRSWLGVPLASYGDVNGLLVLMSEEGSAYTLEHMRVLATIADQAAVALENSRLYELATVDGLTGLYVRRYFDQRLREEFERAKRYKGGFTVGLFDLDHFKRLNDTFGHQVGDRVLRAAAAAVRRNMRTVDLAGRWGGEEFSFILPGTRLDDARIVAERIRADVESLRVPAQGGAAGPVAQVTTSIGLAAYPEHGAHGAEGMFAVADQALYEAKRRGRNRVVLASELSASSEEDGVVVALGTPGR